MGMPNCGFLGENIKMKRANKMDVFLDIETIPAQPESEQKELIAKTIEAPAQMKKPETIQEWHEGVGKYAGVKDAAIEEAYRKTALNGAKGQICSVAISCGDEIKSLSSVAESGEADILKWLSEEFATKKSTPYFIGHNISFDLKFLFQRFVINGINPRFPLPFSGRHGKDYFDNMFAWCGYGERISQDNLCKALGIEGKPGDIDGSKVWDFYKAERIDEIEEYNRDDVLKSQLIYNRLTFSG